MKTYKITSIIEIKPIEDSGKVTLIISLSDEKQPIEADYIEFDHLNGLFIPYNYR